MKTLDPAEDKIQKIADLLRKETIEPAQRKANEILAEANSEAKRIIESARAEADQLQIHARERIAKEKGVFESAMHQGCKQALETLRQLIEKELFLPELEEKLITALNQPDLLAKTIEALVASIEEVGLDINLSAEVAKHVDVEEVTRQITAGVMEKLKKGGIALGDFDGGVLVEWRDRQMTLELTDQALREVLGRLLRRSFRELLFKV